MVSGDSSVLKRRKRPKREADHSSAVYARHVCGDNCTPVYVVLITITTHKGSLVDFMFPENCMRTMLKSRKMRWAGHVARRRGEEDHVYIIGGKARL
jgi:hypothetical protein